MVKLLDEPIRRRAFAQWSIGYEAGGTPTLSETLEEQVDAIVAPLPNASLNACLTGFAQLYSKAG